MMQRFTASQCVAESFTCLLLPSYCCTTVRDRNPLMACEHACVEPVKFYMGTAIQFLVHMFLGLSCVYMWWLSPLRWLLYTLQGGEMLLQVQMGSVWSYWTQSLMCELDQLLSSL